LLLHEFISELTIEIKNRFNITISKTNIVDLDSSTNTKFSRHLIVHMPTGELFADAVTCGIFVKRFIGRLAEDVATGEMIHKSPTLANHLFLYAKELPEDDKGKTDERPKTCFVDTGVYTRNRIFRLLQSMKYGKPSSAALRIAAANQFPFPQNFTTSNEDDAEVRICSIV